MHPIRFFVSALFSAALLAICTSASSAEGNASATAASSAPYLIKPGIGIDACPRGGDATCFTRLFGGTQSKPAELLPFMPTPAGDLYFISLEHGVEAYVENGRIATWFFYFSSPKYKVFNGRTEKGIGKDSSYEDILAAYGPPDECTTYGLPERSGMGKDILQSTLDYNVAGLTFTLHNNRLADIRILKSTPAATVLPTCKPPKLPIPRKPGKLAPTEPSSSPFVIQPGVALDACPRGSAPACFLRLFGGEESSADPAYPAEPTGDYYIVAHDYGVDVLIEQDRISSYFFFFGDPNYKVFNGSTDKGIGKDSSIDDVIRAYGPPDEQYRYGSGKELEISLAYKKLNLNFSFINGRLANVKVVTFRKP